MTVASIRHRFLALVALRWFPVGLLMPVLILRMLDRGLSVAELGIVAVQGFVVLMLELPTGGLADAIGRRRVLLLASVVAIAALVAFLLADGLPGFGIAFALLGVHRALDSGPLEAWYVDETRRIDATAAIDGGLSAAGVALGLAIAAGAIVSGLLVAAVPSGVDALALPMVVALAVQGLGLVAIAWLMTEARLASPVGLGNTVRSVPSFIADGIGLLRRSRVLAALVAVEVTWGAGMVAFETLVPVRLGDLLGDADQAAALLGPASAGAWLVSAAGAAAMPWIGRRLGIAPAAALFRILQALTVVVMALAAGVVGVIAGYLACYAIHGASNPAHMTLVHDEATEEVRATVISLNSMAAQAAGAIGVIALSAIAGAASVPSAMLVGAAILAIGAIGYLPAARRRVVAPALG